MVYYNPNFEKEKTAKPYNTNVLKKWKIKSLIARTDSDAFSSHKDVTILYQTVENKSYIHSLFVFLLLLEVSLLFKLVNFLILKGEADFKFSLS